MFSVVKTIVSLFWADQTTIIPLFATWKDPATISSFSNLEADLSSDTQNVSTPRVHTVRMVSSPTMGGGQQTLHAATRAFGCITLGY